MLNKILGLFGVGLASLGLISPVDACGYRASYASYSYAPAYVAPTVLYAAPVVLAPVQAYSYQTVAVAAPVVQAPVAAPAVVVDPAPVAQATVTAVVPPVYSVNVSAAYPYTAAVLGATYGYSHGFGVREVVRVRGHQPSTSVVVERRGLFRATRVEVRK